MGQLSITYKCCGAAYSMPTEILGAAKTIPALDKLHAEQHPECPPLDGLLPADLAESAS